MRSKLGMVLLACAGVILTGCLETKQEVTINPDGSGKTVFEIRQPLESMMNFIMGSETKAEKSPEQKAKAEVTKILKDSEGVDVWQDVSYEIDDELKLVFKGTAFFKSFNDVKLGGSVKSEKATQITIENNGMTLEWTQGKKGGGASTSEPAKLSDEELALKVKQTQAQLKQSTTMLKGMLEGLKEESIFHLPGKIDEINNFKKIDDNTVSISMNGEDIMKIMEALADNEEVIEAAIREGRDMQKDGPADDFMNEQMFGNTGKTVVHVKDLKPLFDYGKEVEAARASFPAMLEKLGIDIPEPVVLPEIKGAVQGTINGEPFKLEKASVQNGILHLAEGKEFFADKEFVIFLFLNADEKPDGKKYTVTESSGFGSPHVHVKYKLPGEQMPETEMFMDKYTMNLEFGKAKDGAITGKISLVVPTKNKSSISGNFAAVLE